MKVDVETVKTYLEARTLGKPICYVCGTIEPECGMVEMISVNVDPDEISTDMCKDCYNSLWKEAMKDEITPEDVWGLNK